MFKKIGMIGFGLIGGSIAKAIKSRSDMSIYVYSRSIEPLEEAYSDKVIDNYTTNDMRIFSDCDIIFICTPADKITAYVKSLTSIIKKDCIITDVGSTKEKICSELESFDINFIGGHPMAGSEQTGYRASKEYLLENAYYVLVPNKNITDGMLSEFVSLVKLIGAIPIIMSCENHDYAVSAISHVPHIIASGLVNMVKRLDGEEKYMYTLAAGGFKGLTRIASSSPEMWRAVCFENRNEILNVTNEYIKTLEEFQNMLKNEDYDGIYSFFEASRDYRNTFAEKAGYSHYDISIDIADKVGIIADVANILKENNINIKNIGISNNRTDTDGILNIMLEHKNDKEKALNILRFKNYTVK